MHKLHVVGSVVLAAFALLATPATSAAAEQQKVVKKTAAKKKAVKKASRKPVKPSAKPAAKAPPRPQPAVAAAPSTDVQRKLTRAGDYRFAIQHQGLTRTYRVHVPARYTSTEPAPLLVALHGGGIAPATDDGFESLVRESDYQGFIALFPDAYAPQARGARAAWHAGNCCGEARERKVNDLGFIEQAVNNVFKQTSIDRQRIYAAGYSDGGMMAYKLACELPFVFKGIASVGGTDNTATCDPGRPVSVLHLHARNDPRVPLDGAAAPDGPDNARATPALTSARASVTKWAGLDGCEETPRRILDQSGAYCEAYRYCRRQTAVQLCVTDTGGHSWPGAKARGGTQAPSQAIAGTRTMWEFLVSH